MEEKNEKKKLFTWKKILAILLVILVIAVSAVTYLILHKKKDNEFVIGETVNVTEPLNYLVQSEDGEYYLNKVNADIKFKVEAPDGEIKYSLIDEEENNVETTLIDVDGYYEIAGAKNYEAGKTYTLTLENANFVDEKLKDIKKLNFTIVKPNTNIQVLKEDVKKVNNKTIINITQNGDDFTLTSKKKYKEGDIIYYENGDDIKAFKVANIREENGNYIIITATPELEEIYEELDIYGEFTPKITDFISNEELQRYVKVSIAKSGIIDYILDNIIGTTVYAEDIDELIQVEIKPQKDGSVKAAITLNLIGNENSFINLTDMKNHEAVFEMELTLRLKVHNEINFLKTDVGANIDIEVSKALSIKPKEEYWEEFKEEENKNDIESLENAKKILEALKEDTAEEEQNLGSIKIPTPIPGLTVDLGLGLVEKLKLAFQLSATETTNINTTFGYKNGVFKVNKVGFYWYSDVKTTGNTFEAIGKAEAKLGIEPRVEINFIEVIKVGASASIGVYAEGEINYTMSTDEGEKIDGKFEYGTFVEGKVYGKIIGKKIAEKTIYDKKWPLISIGTDIIAEEQEKGIEAALNGDFSYFAGEYYFPNIIKASTTREFITFTLDNEGIARGGYTDEPYLATKPISITRQEDGTIKCIIREDENPYYQENKKEYYIIYPIGIEGKDLILDEPDKVRIQYRVGEDRSIGFLYSMLYTKED